MWTLSGPGENVVLKIEVQGAAQIRARGEFVTSVFILPPSMQELERRLRKRGTDEEEAIYNRLAIASREVRAPSIMIIWWSMTTWMRRRRISPYYLRAAVPSGEYEEKDQRGAFEMLKYDTRALLKNDQSYYSLVVAIARRAREIAEEAEKEKEIITEKPVQLAIDELVDGKIKIIEPNDIGRTSER